MAETFGNGTDKESWCFELFKAENFQEFDRQCLTHQDKTWDFKVKDIISTVMIILGLSGCFLIIFAVLRNKQMRSSRGNILIMNLAISDAILCSVTIPYIIYSSRYWIFGKFMCHLLAIFQAFNVYVATLSITAISLDRFQAIVYPMSSNFMKNIKLPIIIAAIWIISFILASPLYFSRQINVEKGREQCVANNQEDLKMYMLIYTIFEIFFQYLFPLLILIFSYAKIVLRMKHFERLFGDQNQNHLQTAVMKEIITNKRKSHEDKMMTMLTEDKEQEKSLLPLNRLWKRQKKSQRPATFNKRRKRQRTIILLISLALIFAISWLPVHISSLILDYREIEPKNLTFLIILIEFPILLVLASACLNPILYGWLNENFKNEFRSIFRDFRDKFCKKRSTRTNPMNDEYIIDQELIIDQNLSQSPKAAGDE